MRTLVIALALYLIIMIVVVAIKPSVIYDAEQKQYRLFGTAANSTLLPIWLLSFLVAVGSYAFTSVVLSFPAIAALLPFGKYSSMQQSSSDSQSQSQMASATNMALPEQSAIGSGSESAGYQYRTPVYHPTSPFAPLCEQVKYLGNRLGMYIDSNQSPYAGQYHTPPRHAPPSYAYDTPIPQYDAYPSYDQGTQVHPVMPNYRPEYQAPIERTTGRGAPPPIQRNMPTTRDARERRTWRRR